MTDPIEAPPDPRQPAGVRQYTLVSLVALLVVLMALLEKGLGELSLVPVALGCLTLVFHLRFGPPLVLLTLVWILAGQQSQGPDPFRVISFLQRGRPAVEPTGLVFAEIALAAGVLIFTLGFYRTLALVHHLFPIDARLKRGNRPAGIHREKRSAGSVEPHELPLLVGTGFVWSVLAWAFWQWLAVRVPRLGYSYPAWRGLVLFWLVCIAFLATSALLGYLGHVQAGREANALYLQDQLWQQTRREQSRINRWLTWARLRGQRRKEGS